MSQTVTHDHFSECLNQVFRVVSNDSVVDLELIQVDVDQSEVSLPRDRRPFSLLFRGPPEPVLPQRLYAMEHETLGTIEIFIVPIGPDKEGMRYEAVFN